MSESHLETTRAIAEHGFAVVDLDDDGILRFAQPWRLVLGLVGRAPELTEVQPIHPVATGRSFAASVGDAPLHTDSQLWCGRPPELQVTACLRPAAAGGHSVLVDAHALAAVIADRDPGLGDALVRDLRRMPFVFGDVYGPTLARRGGRYVVTHTPKPMASDAVAMRVASVIASVPHHTVELRRGQVLLVDNHRMLHGRTAFADTTRALLRVLAWLPAPLGPRPAWADTADVVAEAIAAALVDASPAVRLAFGVSGPAPDALDLAVLAVASGAPPGALAQRLGVPEPALYRHRDALFDRSRRDVGAPARREPARDRDAAGPVPVTGGGDVGHGHEHDAECMRILERLRARAGGAPPLGRAR